MIWFLSKLSKLAKIKLLDVINLCFCSSSLHLLVINCRKESFETPAPSLEFKERNVDEELEYLSHKSVIKRWLYTLRILRIKNTTRDIQSR